MTNGSPDDVENLIRREYGVFRTAKGGSWFYIEADSGFPFENLKAMIDTIKSLR